jgi:hypothetical protein
MSKAKLYWDYIPSYLYVGGEDGEEVEVDCLLGVTHIIIKKPDYSCRDSDVDYYGFRELEFDVLHMDKTPAPEILALATRWDRERWEEQIYGQYSEREDG